MGGVSTDELSPSERYAAHMKNKDHPVVHDFSALYDFPLDDFQLRACQEIEDGRGVLVAAPTGSGKTVVGEFAIHLALATGRKCFYTTPIKALSNQKYHDLVDRYGPDEVGLLTGDNVVNGEAPVVVMTTEVLRNMLYAGSRTLMGLGFVVMDEVHYLADRSRGAVWEEVMIHLPESVTVVSLSATVSNAEEFGEWLETVRGETTTIVEERRPVPLYQHVMVGRRMLDLFASSDVDAAAGFVKEGAPVNGELMKIARDDWASTRLMRDRRSPRKGKPGSSKAKFSKDGRNVGNGRRVWIPSRADVVDRLDREGLLPAIVFIFSRVGCDAAVQQCLNAGVRLTSPEERDTIHEYVEAARQDLPDEDLHVLGYHDFLEGLTRGIAAHHAGMLPAFKHVVEELYVRGLCKVVFATETLALGINMPARTVVIEKLTKWNGEAHADITPGEYTQLTGRAGRRGLDVEGHGVVLWQPGMNPREVAGLASTRTYPLRSSFRPSYNMAVNLVAPVRPRDLARAAGAVVRPVPGRQGRGRAGPPAAQGGGGARGVRRVRALRAGGLHGVRRPAPPDLRASRRGPARPAAPTAARGDRVAAPAQARRRHRGADRQVRRVRRRDRPQLGRRQTRGPTSSRPTVRPAGSRSSTSPYPWRRWPASRSRSRSTAGTRRCAATWPRRCGPAPTAWRPRRRGAGARRRAAPTPPPSARSRSCGRCFGRTRATPARTARSTTGGRSGGSSWTATPPRSGAGSRPAPTPWPASSTGSARCSPRSAT